MDKIEKCFNKGSQYARMSSLYAPMLKEDPGDAELASHRLLLRAGLIRKTAAGLYSYLALGWRVLLKIETIIREEMDASGAQEILMPILGPAELWEESGRLKNYGPELMRVCDRHERLFVLGPTHEEIITALVRNELRSYKELPLNLYQIQVKFRDELRPRFGLMRGREFIMKDAYSFDKDEEGMQASFDLMFKVYTAICKRLSLNTLPVSADSGQIGGAHSLEFMALADSGEADIIYCKHCGYAADIEAATANISVKDGPTSALLNNTSKESSESALTSSEVSFENVSPSSETAVALQKVATPQVQTIADLAQFFSISPAACKKAVALLTEEETPRAIVVILPGDHELNEVKAAHAFGAFHIMSDEELKAAGLIKGFIGPVGLPDGVELVCDESLKKSKYWLVGANALDTHLIGACPGRDFEVGSWLDLVSAKPGDGCPHCGEALAEERGIEVGQIFQLGDKYSKALEAHFLDKDGKEKPFQMGCYGIGVSRALAAVVEQHHDEDGIVWPCCVAPYEVHILLLDPKQDEVRDAAEQLAEALFRRGIQVLLDDRDERAGVKFSEADLLGLPFQIIVGKRGFAEKTCEVKKRKTQEKEVVSLKDVIDRVETLVVEAKNR